MSDLLESAVGRARRLGPMESSQVDHRRRLYYRGPLVRPSARVTRSRMFASRWDTHAATADHGLRSVKTNGRSSSPSVSSIQHRGGVLIERRAANDPERSFDGHQARDPMGQTFHLAYFSGEALWTYLNTPFPLRLGPGS